MYKSVAVFLTSAALIGFGYVLGSVRNPGPLLPAVSDAVPPGPATNAIHAAQSEPGPTNTRAPNAPPNEQERPKLKARYSRWLLDQLDRIEGGTDQERELIRETLRRNDDALDRAFRDMSGRIRAANNTHDGPRRIYVPE